MSKAMDTEKEKKTLIRDVEEADAQKIAAIYQHFVQNTTITFEVEPPSAEEMCARIRKYTVQYPWIVLEVEDEVVGYAYASAFRERISYQFTTEVSVYLSYDRRGAGYGRMLAEELLQRLEKRGFYVAIAGITATNQASVRFFEKLGFESCADFVNVGYKNGEWLSVLMLSKNLQPEFLENPAVTQ